MGDRTVEYSRFFQCDGCGAYGAYDFYGDYICNTCIKKSKEEESKMGNDIRITYKGDTVAVLGRRYNYEDMMSRARINMLFAEILQLQTKMMTVDVGVRDYHDFHEELEENISLLWDELEKRGMCKVLHDIQEDGDCKIIDDYNRVLEVKYD